MKNVIIITGASSGIGMEFALQLDLILHTIDEFWLIARREGVLKDLEQTLHHKVRVIPMDVTDRKAVIELTDKLYHENATVRMLINCAGFGLIGNFANASESGQLNMIRVNCEALTDLTHSILPFMKKGSRIIQMASSAAFLPQANFAVYAASKSYVLSFSRALNEELKNRGITVTAVCPGPVDTPFFDIAEQNGKTLSVKKYVMVSPDRVVKKALYDSFHKRSVSVCGLPMKSLLVISKALPHSILLKVTAFLSNLDA